MCRDGDFPGGRIGGNKFYFVDPDRRIRAGAQCFLDLLGEILGLGAPHGKRAHQVAKVFQRHFAREQNAGQSGSGQQLCETSLRLPGFDRNAVDQQLVVGNAQHETRVSALGQSLLQLAPGRLKLALCAFVVGSVQSRVLNEDVETVEESLRGRAAACVDLSGVRNNSLLLRIELWY